jgi:2-amino-1-hydroxyethylphosphonate dioxygenase (glycine-forming)
MIHAMNDQVREVFSLYELAGGERYFNHPVTQLNHASATASYAAREGFDDDVVVAAFLHDIGHLCTAVGKCHPEPGRSSESTGADYLRMMGFPDAVAWLLENQTKARQYLTSLYPSFFVSLGKDRQDEVIAAGGPLPAKEAADFEQEELFRPSIRLVFWDERSNKPGLPAIHFSVVEAKARNIIRMAYANP